MTAVIAKAQTVDDLVAESDAIVRPMAEVVRNADGTGKLVTRFHAGQLAAHHSTKRNVIICAGTQSGKTSYGPHWLYREIQRCGPGDYVVVSPTYVLMQLKALPEFRRLFEGILQVGTYFQSPIKRFIFSEAGFERTFGRKMTDNDPPTVVYFGHAQNAESLESATYKAGWLDEAGQKQFRRASHEALERRFALHRARKLLTTTPYDLGVLYTEYWEPWERAGRNHPTIDIFNFPSYLNPAFPMASYEEARDTLPEWKFHMFYDGIPTRPAGLIYSCFDPDKHVVDDYPIPFNWPRFRGIDFGGTNTAAVCWAEILDKDNNRTGRYVQYREYRAGDLTAKEHIAGIRAGDKSERPGINFGGAASEKQWRQEFGAAGMTIHAPKITEVEVGILRLFAGLKTGRLQIMRSCKTTIEMYRTYSRPVDDRGDPMPGIEDKEKFHELDASRYIGSYLFRTAKLPGVL